MLRIDIRRAVEATEQIRQRFGWDANARVGDSHRRVMIAALNSHDDLAALRALLDCVLNKVLERLLQAQLIATDQRGRA